MELWDAIWQRKNEKDVCVATEKLKKELHGNFFLRKSVAKWQAKTSGSCCQQFFAIAIPDFLCYDEKKQEVFLYEYEFFSIC